MADSSRDEHLRQEAALLADVPPTHPVRIRVSGLRSEDLDGARHRWYHVLHVDEAIHARISLLAQTLRVERYDLVDSSHAAVALIEPAEQERLRGAELTVGCMAGHTAVAFSQNGQLVFSSHGAGETAEDTAYFALSTLQRIGLDTSQVGRLLVYGDAYREERLEVLQQLVGRPVEILDPLARFERRPEGISPEDLAAYVPVLGAAFL